MTDKSAARQACDLLISEITEHFAEKKWAPLLWLYQPGLRELCQATLETLLPKVKDSSDRDVAVALIAAAITDRRDDPPDDGDMTDSALLRLR